MKSLDKLFLPFALLLITNIMLAQSVNLRIPENFARELGTKELYFEWYSNSNVLYYQFELSRGVRFTKDDIVARYDRIDTNVVVMGLENSRTYYWRVRAIDEEWSDIWNFTTTARPVRPSLVSPENELINLDTSAIFSWIGNPINLSYRIEVSPSGNFSYSVKRETVIDTIIDFGGLLFNTKYYWRVRGENIDQEFSSWSDIFTFNTMLDVPSNIFPMDSSRNISTNPKLSWEKISGAEYYLINLSIDSSFTNTIIDDTTSITEIQSPLLDNYSVYYWRIKSFGLDGMESNWSDTFNFRTNQGLTIEPESLVDTINFSIEPRTTLKPIYFLNPSDEEIRFDSIAVLSHDSVFSLNETTFTLLPNSIDSLITLVDTSKIDTSFVAGRLLFYSFISETVTDSFFVDLTLYINEAFAFLSQDTLSFDSTYAGVTASARFYLSNKGNYNLSIKSLKVFDEGSSSFEILSFPSSVAPFDSAAITVRFEPDSLGLHLDSLYIKTNSYPDTLSTVLLKAKGFGPSFSKKTLDDFRSLAEVEFETFLNNFHKLTIENIGTTDLNITVGFKEKYFELFDILENSFRIEVAESDTLNIKYMTPNFDSLNVDTLKIWHNSFGKSPIAVPLSGSHDELNSAQLLQSNIKVNNKSFVNEDYIFPEKTAVQFFLDPVTLENYENLSFRVKYYLGGPGNSLIAPSGGDNKYVIPYQNVKDNGLLFSSELVSYNPKYRTYDSTRVFNFVNGQVVSDNYTSPTIEIPYSIPSTKVENADAKWVLFGFPANDVIADTVFNYFGGREMMKDGEWIIYEYSPEGYKPFSDYYFTPNKGYFVAQSLLENIEINYKYENSLLSRKLTDSLFTIEGSGWRAISSPYTFDVEVDSSVILYTYDTNNKAYRITSIMRPGVGYFVGGNTGQIKLKTYGEYYPNLFPKIVSNSDIAFKAYVASSTSTQEVIIGRIPIGVNSEILADVAPSINNGLDVYLLDDKNQKSLLSLNNFDEGNSWNLVIQTRLRDEEFTINLESLRKVSNNYSLLIYDKENLKSYTNYKVKGFITKGEKKQYKILIGTDKFLQKELQYLNNGTIDKFSLGHNYPNPFNPSTIIQYAIPTSENNNYVNLSIYNTLGQLVDIIVNERKSAGNYEVVFDASKLVSGIYFYRLKVGEFVETKKMTFLK